jgi:SAM-dependent methyltransferase
VEAVAFDYESKRWGNTEVFPRPWYLQGLKLRYCLEDLTPIRGLCIDVGCGGGNMARAIKRERPDLQVCGVDVSRGAIEQARGDPRGVQFMTTTGNSLPFPAATADAVVMFDVLEHVTDPAAMLAEVARVLKRDGLFHIVLPLEGQPWTIYNLLRRRGWDAKRRHSGHVQAFDATAFRTMAEAAGLPVRRVRWSFHPLFALVDVLYYRWLDIRGPVSGSVEDMLAHRTGLAAFALTLLKRVVASAGWYESRVLRWLPGACGHFTSIRR